MTITAMPRPKKVKTRDARLAIRIHMDLRDRLQAMADSENRTLANMIELLLQRSTEKGGRR